MAKELAIMSQPDFGMRDMSYPNFWFSVSFGENLSSGALIVLSAKQMAGIMKEADIYNLKALKDHPCQIDVDGLGAATVTFIKILKR